MNMIGLWLVGWVVGWLVGGFVVGLLVVCLFEAPSSSCWQRAASCCSGRPGRLGGWLVFFGPVVGWHVVAGGWLPVAGYWWEVGSG